MLKSCTKCSAEKPGTLEFFHAQAKSPGGLRSVCKVCRAAAHHAARDQAAEKKRAHYQANRERIAAKCRADYAKNPEPFKAAARARHHKNRDHNLQRSREYREKNLEALNARRRPRARAQYRERYGIDLIFTLKHRMRALVGVSLKKRQRSRRLEESLGFTLDELRSHLEALFVEGMNWEAFMRGEIHVDHKIPIAFFAPSCVDSPEFKACWALENLQPLWAQDNLKKAARLPVVS